MLERTRLVRSALLAACAAAGARPIALAQSSGWESAGEKAFDECGAAVASAGDVDGDGLADVIVGAWRNDGAGADSGRAYVRSGHDGSLLLTLTGIAAGDQFGFAAGAVGDLDGDGRDDVWVGAPQHDGGGSNAGAVTVHSGADGSIVTILHGSAGERFGSAAALLGDVDGDGVPEIVVGAPRSSVGGVDRGRVHVVSLASGARLLTLSGEAAGDWFGVAVAALGDVDGDGLPDFAVGADRHDLSGADRGRVTVHGGADGSVLAVFDGLVAGDHFGIALAAVGDFDGDGIRELLVGSPNHDAAGSNSGRATVVSVGEPAPLLDLLGDAANDLFGSAVASAGDFDCDGSTDLAIGAWGSSEGGSGAGKVKVVSGTTGTELFSLLGSASGERFGIALAGAGDADGSGCPDLLVGASYSNAAGTRSGRAELFFSDHEPPNRAPEITAVEPDRARHDEEPAVTLRGSGFFGQGPPIVRFGADFADEVVVVDDSTITCRAPAGAPGPLDVSVGTAVGSDTAEDAFRRTPALEVEGELVRGEDATVRTWCEYGDLVIVLFGPAAERTIRLGTIGHHLDVFPYRVILVDRSSSDELALVWSIPERLRPRGSDLRIQAAVLYRGGGGCFTNSVDVTIE